MSVFSGDRPIAFVTGGAKRVGRASCLALARAGCDVLTTYRSSEDEAMALAGEVRELDREADGCALDLDDLDSVTDAGERLARELPRLDVLVHNASVYAPSPLEKLSADELLAQYRVNAAAPALLSSRLAPLLRASDRPGGGAVVAMCDIHAMGRPRAGHLAYAMSKAALVELINVLALNLAPEVRVNGVAPGVVEWPDEGYESDEASQQRYLKRVPLDRPGTPEEAAETVRWLALDATYLTGQVVRVDGGRWIT
ncbi:MAG: SDR family oxidoreductase [Planctomycetota bacterium]